VDQKAAVLLAHGDVIKVGQGDQWAAQIIGTHDTVDDEVMVVLVLPADATFTLIEEGKG
jgi:hypothetical protein